MPTRAYGDYGDNAAGRMRFRTPFKAGLYLEIGDQKSEIRQDSRLTSDL